MRQRAKGMVPQKKKKGEKAARRWVVGWRFITLFISFLGGAIP